MWIIIDKSDLDNLKIVMVDPIGGYGTKYFETAQDAMDYAERDCIDYQVVEVDI